MKKILITGGSGFIGRNIKESFLNSKYTIVAPPHDIFDLTDENQVGYFLKNENVDVIIHSAGKPGHRNAPDPSNICFENSKMFFNLIKYRDLFGKLIIIGSGGIYNLKAYRPKMKEEFFGRSIPEDEHGFFRYICGKYIEGCLDDVYDLRVFGIYGRYEDYAIRFISNMICKAIFDLPLTMHQDRNFDYLFIEDLMPVLDFFIVHEPEYKSYNITPDKSVSLREITGIVLKTACKDLPVIAERAGKGPEYSGDNSRLKREYKDVSFTPLDEGIARLYQWYSDHKKTIKKELLLVDK